LVKMVGSIDFAG